MTPRRELAVLILVALVLGSGGAVALTWPLVLDLRVLRPVGAFHDGHVWAFSHMAGQLTGALPLDPWTDRIGYPDRWHAALIAWGGGILATPLQGLLGAQGAYNAVLLLTPGLTAAVVGLLVRRLTGAAPLPAALAGLAAAASPVMLGFLASGQVAKLYLWAPGLALLFLARCTGSPGRAAAFLALPLAGALSAFTAPSLTLYLPFAAGLVVLHEVWRAGSRVARLRALLAGAVALGLLAASLLPARSYHQAGLDAGAAAAFLPASSLIRPRDPFAEPRLFAQPEEILWGGLDLGGVAADQTQHVPYLGLLALGVVLLAALLRGRGALLGLGLVAAGVSLALGPQLAHDDAYVTLADGSRLGLPAYALEALGYPLAKSGMYYRALALASLGVAVSLGALATRLPRRLALPTVTLLTALLVADGLRVTASLWPRATAELPGRELLASLRGGAEGAVLALPLDSESLTGEHHLLAATLHGRATTGLPINVFPERLPRVAATAALLEEALSLGPPEGLERLRDAGFAAVTWLPAGERPHHRSADRLAEERARLEGLLGPAEEQGGLLVWRLSPEVGGPAPGP